MDKARNQVSAAVQANTTKEGIVVMPGQVWRDLDKRVPLRHCKVEAVRDGKAIMYPCTAEGGTISTLREVKVSISRMHKSSTGWKLVKPVSGMSEQERDHD